MKRAFLVALIPLLWLAQAQAGPALTPVEGQTTTAVFTLPDLKSKPHALEDYRGRVVLVNFWATWCPSCIREMPDLERLRDTFAAEPFDILTVNVGEPKFKVWKFIKLVDFDLPVLLDTRKQLFQSWDMHVLPTSLLLDRDGRIRYRVQGAPQWDDAQTLSIIRELLEQQENRQ